MQILIGQPGQLRLHRLCAGDRRVAKATAVARVAKGTGRGAATRLPDDGRRILRETERRRPAGPQRRPRAVRTLRPWQQREKSLGVVLRREADVLIDSQGPILDAILKWSHRACGRVNKEILTIENEVDLNKKEGEMQEEEDERDDRDAGGDSRILRRQFLFDTTSTEYLTNIQRA